MTEAVLARAAQAGEGGVLLDPAALAAAPREVGLRALAALLMAVSGQAYRPRFERWSGFSTRSAAALWAAAPPCMAATFARRARRRHRFWPQTLVARPESSRKTGSSAAQGLSRSHAVLRQALKILNVLMAGNALETSYLIRGRIGPDAAGRPGGQRRTALEQSAKSRALDRHRAAAGVPVQPVPGHRARTPPPRPITYSKFNEQVVQNQVRKVTFQGDQVKGELTNGQPFTTTVPANDTTLWPTLKAHNVDTTVIAGR